MFDDFQNTRARKIYHSHDDASSLQSVDLQCERVVAVSFKVSMYIFWSLHSVDVGIDVSNQSAASVHRGLIKDSRLDHVSKVDLIR